MKDKKLSRGYNMTEITKVDEDDIKSFISMIAKNQHGDMRTDCPYEELHEEWHGEKPEPVEDGETFIIEVDTDTMDCNIRKKED